MSALDSFLNRITLPRLVLLVLWVLAGIAIAESMLHWTPYPAIEPIISLLILLLAARAVNAACALFTKAAVTPESAYITALILFFVLSPIQSSADALYFMLAAAIAMLSKYLFAVGKKHAFNPAALAALVLSSAGTGLVVWWVASPIMLPFVLLGGFVVLRKARQFEMFAYFAGTAAAIYLVPSIISLTQEGVINVPGLLSAAHSLLITGPFLFLGAFMLTDPQTMPNSLTHQRVFGVIVGALFSASFAFSASLGSVASSALTPEMALLLGNVYAFSTNIRRRVALLFHSATKLSRDMYEYAFEIVPAITSGVAVPAQFYPGQHAEFTLPHKSPDKRGIRRHFSMTSTPTDPYFRIAVRMPIEASTFKQALRAKLSVGSSSRTQGFNQSSKEGNLLSFTNVSGLFVLPANPDQKILALADGPGIAPFISMLRHLVERRERRHIVMVYTAPTPLDFAYQEELESFKDRLGIEVLYVPVDFSELSGWEGPSGFLTDELIRTKIPDFLDRHWYISGPASAVTSYKAFAKKLGLPPTFIKTESFSGL